MNDTIETTAALVHVGSNHHHAPALLEPIVEPKDLVAAHAKAAKLITEALESGTDYGVVPGTGGKPSLLKPGAERLRLAFGLGMKFVIIEHEKDHDRVVTYFDRNGKERTSLGLYRVVVKCILTKNGEEVGEGDGTCSTLEAKYVSRPRDCENTVVKMAEKRAFIAAILFTLGLSNRFTQDVEDHSGDHEERAKPAAPKQATIEQKKQAGALLKELGITEGAAKYVEDINGGPVETYEQAESVLAVLQSRLDARAKAKEAAESKAGPQAMSAGTAPASPSTSATPATGDATDQQTNGEQQKAAE